MARQNRHRLLLQSLEPRDVPSAVGELDPTFGTDGKMVEPSVIFGMGGQQAVVDRQGRTLIAGNKFSSDCTSSGSSWPARGAAR